MTRTVEVLKTHWVWLLPAVTLIILSPYSTTNVDATRDFIMAHRIISGDALPLLGPQLAFSFHIGPGWLYLMAVPLLLLDSWLSLAVAVTILNACKFYLAFRLGCLLLDKQLGHLLVLALMMVSLTLMQTITFTHTSVVETSMLLVICYCVVSPLRHALNWLLLGLLVGMAFHSHPTAVVCGFFAVSKWWCNPHKIKYALVFLLGLLPWFLPVLVNAWLNHENEMTGLAGYFTQQTNGFDLLALPQLLYGLIISAPLAMLSTAFTMPWAVVLFTIQLLIQLLAWMTPVIKWRQLAHSFKCMHLMFVLFFILSCIGAVLIRDKTPWYMSYGLSLAHALVIASGLYALFSVKVQRLYLSTLSTLVTVTFLFSQVAIVQQLATNQIRLPGITLNNIRSMSTQPFPRGYELLAKDASRHGKFTCMQQPVALHGPYSALIYSHSGMEHLSECGSNLYYGPADGANHVLGIPGYFQQLIKVQPFAQIGDSYFHRPKAMSMAQHSWQENYQHDYEKRIKYLPNWTTETQQITMQQGQYLLITKVLGYKMDLNVLEVKVNGQIIQPVERNAYATLYACNDCQSQQTTWQISYQESVAGMTNVVTF